ncbi:hypothetical protein [Amycolatopsis sp. lyj-108]|uniref:hypothetical protein n=1 Tax=Amycolatopsis sp. lyj-108 TaxID=2789286 RepID=UPI00397D10D6
MVDYLGPGHTARLTAAMNTFHKALTKRWREDAATAIEVQSDLTQGILRCYAPGPNEHWDYRSPSARAHIDYGTCSYLDWVEDGQQGELSAVTCEGKTGHLVVLGDRNPPKDEPIVCGVGSILAQVETWAWDERTTLFTKLPMFDAHNLSLLEAAHNDFLSLGKGLGLEAEEGSPVSNLGKADGRELGSNVEALWSERTHYTDWWASWTGLSANRAKDGFFASVGPTLQNQSGITGALANLYSLRAAIVEMARNDALFAIQQATKALGETETITTDLASTWKVVAGAGAVLGVAGIWFPPAGGVGAVVGLVGFLGENLLKPGEREGYAHGVREVVFRLGGDIDELNNELTVLESDYTAKVGELRSRISQIKSFNLELYDLSLNTATGDPKTHGGHFTVDISTVLEMAKCCYDTAELYEPLMRIIKHTKVADKHLADEDGKQTWADIELADIRDALEGFLSTTCARYALAGDNTVAAAKAYGKTDRAAKEASDRILADWERVGKQGNPVPHRPAPGSGADTARTDRDEIEPTTLPPWLHPGENPTRNDEGDYETERQPTG